METIRPVGHEKPYSLCLKLTLRSHKAEFDQPEGEVSYAVHRKLRGVAGCQATREPIGEGERKI